MVGSVTGNAGKERAVGEVGETEGRRSSSGRSSSFKEARGAAGSLSLCPALCPRDTNLGEPDQEGWQWGEQIPADVHRRSSREERGRRYLCDNELAEGVLCAWLPLKSLFLY